MKTFFDSADIMLIVKELEKKIHKLSCSIEELCGRIPVNIGGGVGLFKRLYKNKFEFKTLFAGSNVTITENDNSITISSSGGGSSYITSVSDTSTINLTVSSGDLHADFVSLNISQFTNNSGYLTQSSADLLYYPLSNPNNFISLIDLSGGTGISYNNLTGVITNSAPDQTVVLSAGTGIGISGTYPSFTITNTSPSSGGTVTSFSSGNLSPLFTTAVANSTTTPSQTFRLSDANAHTWFGNNSGVLGSPSYNSAGSLTETTSSILAISGSNSLLNNTTISVQQATSLKDGYLSSTDWNTFNNKGNGTVTSVSLTMPAEFIVSGSPVTTAGTFIVQLDPSYLIPTTTQRTQWDLAYTNRITTLTTTGTSGAATLISNVLNIPQYTDQYTGTVTSVAALTLGTTGTDLSSTVANSTTTPVITLNVPTASATNRGVLSSTDWTTFNNKGNGTVTSIGITAGTGITVSGSPVTSSGNITVTSTGGLKFFAKSTTTTSYTGTLAETQFGTGILIPANTAAIGDIIEISPRFRKTGTAGTMTPKIRIHTSDAVAGNVIMGSTALAATNLSHYVNKVGYIKSSTAATEFGALTTYNDLSNGTTAGAIVSYSIDWTVDQYIIFTGTLANTGDTCILSGYTIKIY